MIRFGQNMVSLKQPISFMKRRPAPHLLAPPFISKTDDPVIVGSLLTYVPGEYVDALSVAWAWYSDAVLAQAGGPTYTVVAGDVGHTITIIETATNPGGDTVTTTAGILVP